ncbi:hypothetical protein AKJ09_07509 [Labilithrix luteola]|uniref:Lipoprotein n=1 Tax=Labilithrix luteola TaxID=1391654 RepID=A0A0K1Q4T6_9BACT|nr:hypothetical protein [Labilithrix luteola]AKV00846.1 hypothetical protein AKJ09_07509 [Labilithrix luteola]
MRPRFVVAGFSGFSLASLAIGVLAVVGCASSSNREGFDEPPATSDGSGEPAPAPTGDFDTTKPPPKSDPVEINEVYGHSATTLYRLDPEKNEVTTVGDFNGCTNVWDIALDENAAIWGVTKTQLFKIDKTTATCTAMPSAAGLYPNSLSFVPKGTIDANAEALVGYEDADYVRIDPATGEKTKIGSLGTSGLISSGDIVSVKGGSTYLTVKPGLNCKTSECTKCKTNDCLVEVDPVTGKLKKNWGSVEHKDVFGLSFWGGRVYGFDQTGEVFEVTFGTTQLATAPVTMASRPDGLKFWGAGSATTVPLTPPTK